MNCMPGRCCGSLEHLNVRDPNRRLRIGLLSPDCQIHPGGHFFLPIVEGLNRADFEVLLLQLHCPGRVDGTLRAFFRSLPSCSSLER